MKKATIYLVAAVLMLVCLPTFAQQFPDVPTDHWAYQAVSELAEQGIIQGYPDGTFGGKRALTRYEFAQALARAIPVIAEIASGGGPGQPGREGPVGPPGPVGPAGPPGNAADIANLQRLVNEFQEELAAQGVDIEALRRDLNALADRVSAVEREQARVVFTGEANMYARGEVQNSTVLPFDKDSRPLAGGGPDDDNPLSNSAFFNDFDFKVKGRISDTAALRAVINAGDYLDFALNPGLTDDVDDFRLWNFYLDSPVSLGPLGAAQVMAGRFPMQLTPYTMKFVDPDAYTNVPKLDSGDFLVDGGALTLNFGRVALTGFAGKSVNSIADLITPDLVIPGVAGDTEVSQFAGGRAVIGGAFGGNIGLTYLQTGLAIGSGRAENFGADVNFGFGSLGINAEYAQSEPNDTMLATVPGASDDDNVAWNAALALPLGNLGLGVGYQRVEQNYFAPGYWSRFGRAVNLTNVKGPMANLTYALSSRISLTADASFLEPEDDGVAITGRSSTVQDGNAVSAAGVDKVNAWRAGIKYALTSTNSVDLGWEQVTWEPTGVGADDEERYISIGLGHTFNPNASLKLLYQIVEYELGGVNPYGSAGNSRGGVAAAQFQLKY